MTAPRELLALPLLALMGCAGEPPAEGTEAQQAIARIMDLRADDPRAALEAINGLSSDLEQQLAVEQIVIHGPPTPLPPGTCDLLERTPTRERCLALAERPHLYKLPRSDERGADGLDPVAIESEYTCLGTSAAGGDTPFEVAVAAALSAVAAERANPAVSCDCLADREQERECRFMAAEQMTLQFGAAAIPKALAQCDFGGVFARDCVTHVLGPVLAALPSTCPVDDGDWSLLFLDGYGFQGQETGEGGEVGEQRRWSRATATAFARVFQLPPEMGAALPPAAAPQLRAIAAWWAVEASPDPLDLTGLRATATDMLAGNRASRIAEGAPALLARIEGAHTFDPPPSLPGGISSTVYLVQEYRALGADGDADLIICLLEASRSQGRELEPLLVQAESFDDPAVRHTIGRLRSRPFARE